MGGAGTDTAMEAADVVVMNDGLRRIPETIRLSRRAPAVLWQNIPPALGIKAVVFLLAIFGSTTCVWRSLQTWVPRCSSSRTVCACSAQLPNQLP